MRRNTVLLAAGILGGCLLFQSCPHRAIACDLMGVCFDKEVELGELFSRFRRISERRDPDGWGVALYGDASATVFKQPISAADSQLAETLVSGGMLKSKILITHLRAASIGRPSPRNTHPWVRELGGREYAFAHVGGADRRLWKTIKLGRFQPLGENCAEYMFCHILAQIEEQELDAWNRESFERLHQVLAALNRVQTTSHLLSDGIHLFAYSNRGSGSWLSYVEREMAAVEAKSGEATGKAPAVGVIVARNGHNLAERGESWTRIPPGQLIVFENGKIVYASEASQ